MNTPSPAPSKPAPARPPAPRPTAQMKVGCFIIPAIVAVLIVSVFLYVRLNATNQLTVPEDDVVLARAMPDESAPLLARFGEGRTLTITGRTEDWRWLEVELWDNQRGWTLRPLDILVWQLDAPVVTPVPPESVPQNPAPIAEETISVPETTFTMGSPPGIGDNDERPAHPVNVSAFDIDRTEVTVGQYWQCVQAGNCKAPTNDASATEPHYINDPAFDNHPVINVSWTEANNYCIWRGKRLPTEAQWELVASWDVIKNAKSQWPWGNDPAQGEGSQGEGSQGEGSQGEGNVDDASLGDATVVGSFPTDQSALGALDMAGNVSEWIFDWYKVDYYSVADDTDPVGPSNRRGEGTGRVVRGGSFADTLNEARTTNRRHQSESYGYPAVGFRCVNN